ncbi:unnamed protein product, partial [Vitis vinifera]|uniref:Uncharacterized protein n=1 Tax=Vitis vinifera TaxID=29760 RepID=D7T8C0_VITVI
MAGFEAPSFSLGLDLELDFDLEPRSNSNGTQQHSLYNHAPRNLTVEFEAYVSDSDPEVSAPALKRLRRGPGRVHRRELAEAWCNVDEEIEEFSSQEGFRRDEHPSTQYHSVCSSSKFPLRASGVLTSRSASHRKADANQEAKNTHPSAKVRQSNHRQYSCASEDKSTKTFVSMPQNVDLWKDFWPNRSVGIPTPALDEVCEEYFRSVKDKNVTVKLGSDGCISNEKRSYQNKNNRKTVQHQLDLADPLPPAHRYFFHADPRIQKLVRSRLPNFSPLGVVSNTNMQHGASVIDYMSQFSHGEASKKQVNQDVSIGRSTMQARKNARKFNADEALNASGSWVNPKSCASIPKKAGKGQVHANGQSASRWYTSPDGRKVYVTKSGQELTGSMAYRHYKKDNGVRSKKSKGKTTARRTSKKKQKT